MTAIQSVERAWQSYAKSLPINTKNCRESRSEICEFVGVSPATIRRWMTANSVEGVEGINAIKLRIFLELVGYNVAELASIRSTVKTFAEILAFGIVTTEEACLYIYGDFELRTLNRTYDLFFGRSQKAMPETMAKIESFVQNHRSEVAVQRRLWQEKLQKNVQLEESSTPRVIAEKSAHGVQALALPVGTPGAKDVVKSTFIALARSLVEITEYIASDAFTAEERKTLRAAAGEQVVFRLSTATARLCNETSRTQFANTTGVRK